tara:strand:+ start:1134 stop:1400 length:267 start_codon:yes stop_codon:yes gene_type:complete
MNTVNDNIEPLLKIVKSGDTNYIVGLLVAIVSARSLQQKEKNEFYYDKYRKPLKIIIGTLFLFSIVIISTYNPILGAILAILFISMNL